MADRAWVDPACGVGGSTFTAASTRGVHEYSGLEHVQLRHAEDKPSIGLLLCKERDHLTIEYALRDLKKPIGVAQWQTRLVDSLPKTLKGNLPTVQEIESELNKKLK